MDDRSLSLSSPRHDRRTNRKDLTMADLLPALPENWDRCLAVAAHPDDIEEFSASAVARWTAQGKQVTYLLASRGEAGIDSMHPDQAGPLREAEERAGAAHVGVD